LMECTAPWCGRGPANAPRGDSL